MVRNQPTSRHDSARRHRVDLALQCLDRRRVGGSGRVRRSTCTEPPSTPSQAFPTSTRRRRTAEHRVLRHLLAPARTSPFDIRRGGWTMHCSSRSLVPLRPWGISSRGTSIRTTCPCSGSAMGIGRERDSATRRMPGCWVTREEIAGCAGLRSSSAGSARRPSTSVDGPAVAGTRPRSCRADGRRSDHNLTTAVERGSVTRVAASTTNQRACAHSILGRSSVQVSFGRTMAIACGEEEVVLPTDDSRTARL